MINKQETNKRANQQNLQNQQNKTSKGENQHTNIQINILQSRKLTLAYKQTHRQTHKPTKQTCKQSWQRRVAVEETGYISLPVFVDGTLIVPLKSLEKELNVFYVRILHSCCLRLPN
jgi:hypothetical protein